MKYSKYLLRTLLLVAFMGNCGRSVAQSTLNKDFTKTEIKALEKEIADALGKYPKLFEPYKGESVGKIMLEKAEVDVDKNRVMLHLTRQVTFIALREEMLIEWEEEIRELLYEELKKDFEEVKVGLYYNNIPLERFIPNVYREKIDKDSRRYGTPYSGTPLLKNNAQSNYSHGLSGRHIAIWASHGFLYESRDEKPEWKFQRPALFRTVEDLNSFDFIYRYLSPMLENSGATLLMPRERTPQREEVIVDNDHTPKGSRLVLHSGKWERIHNAGFRDFDTLHTQNPFNEGSIMQCRGEASAEFIAQLPKSGRYGVTIAYKTLLDSPSDVTVEVKHLGGVTTLKLNQQMMGSTWLYLGEWDFGSEGSVRLNSTQGTLTIDAVRWGGGMGRVVRGGTTSGVPQWVEAARYYMQFCGVPQEIYRTGEFEKFGKDSEDSLDYVDDYKARGNWVNWLINKENVPLDLALTPHTNAGVVDSIFGTLTIHYTEKGKGKLRDGSPKFVCRELADMVQSQIVADMRSYFTPDWTRRSLYDMQYAECSRPSVPTVILEMVSHQNKSDMDYFCDPKFRFYMARATYKGILKFLAYRYNIPYVVQPLPPYDPQMIMKNDSTVILSWRSNFEKNEPTSRPKYYKLYCREGAENSAFDQGKVVSGNSVELEVVRDGVIRSYQVTAVNSGGESFQSEVLSCGFSPNDSLEVLTVQNKCDILGGTVPYIHDWSYTGEVYDWDKNSQWVDNEIKPGYGASYKSFVGKGRSGETFDNTTMQGKKIVLQHRSYISSGSGLNHWLSEKKAPKELHN